MTDNQQSPQQPSQPTPPPASQPLPPPDAISGDTKTLAMLAHMLGIISGFIGALVIYLVKKDQDAFINDQAKEALNFQITVAIAAVASSIVGCLGLFFLPHAVWIANIVFCILGGLKAKEGFAYRYPVTFRFIK